VVALVFVQYWVSTKGDPRLAWTEFVREPVRPPVRGGIFCGNGRRTKTTDGGDDVEARALRQVPMKTCEYDMSRSMDGVNVDDEAPRHPDLDSGSTQ
jgi:hypothetical protein